MTLPPISWQAWIFDLDDTLLDTSGLLVPEAIRRACEFLVTQKIFTSVEEGLNRWTESRTGAYGANLFYEIIPLIDDLRRKQLAEQAYRIFRSPPIPKNLELRLEGRQLLELAAMQFPIFLVTQGDIDVQMRKVEELRIISYFKHVYYIDPFANENKLKAFNAILSQWQFDPKRVLSIGNRLDNEIEFSKSLGMKTCYVRHGEHAHDQPRLALQIPDYDIVELSELRKILRLSINLEG